MTVELVGAMVGRAAEVDAAYRDYRAAYTGTCPFCDDQTVAVARHRSMLVVRNRFPYVVWDAARVEDHLMIVPVRHTLSLDEFTDAEAAGFFAVARRYEAAGYSLYSRAPANRSRSVGHVHTHLIATGDFI